MEGLISAAMNVIGFENDLEQCMVLAPVLEHNMPGLDRVRLDCECPHDFD